MIAWRRGADRTEWVIAAVPLGGYVKMLDEREGPVEPHEAARPSTRQIVWQRFCIVMAGPLFNFLFAVLVYAGLFMYGLPEARPVLAAPPSGTLAARPGLRAGATVGSVDGEPVATWQELRWRLLQAALQRSPVRLETVDERGHLAVATLDLSGFPAADVESDVLERIGLRLYRPPLEPVLGQVVGGGPAQRAGPAPGDPIARVDGRPIDSWESLVAAGGARPRTTPPPAVRRGGPARTPAG